VNHRIEPNASFDIPVVSGWRSPPLRAASVRRVRWDSLFDDLESQLERELTAEELDLAVEEERLRLGRLSMRDRVVVLAGLGRRVRVEVDGGERIDLRLGAIGRDWVAGELVAPRRAQCILPLSAVASLVLSAADLRASLAATPQDDDPAAALPSRLGLPFVLRDLCRRRREVELLVGSGAMVGTIDRVGRDHVDLAVHEPGTARREDAVTEYRLVPLHLVRLIRF
jgi:hypothetical protein